MTSERQKRLHELYFGDSGSALRFQSWMLLLDVVLIAFFIVAPFIERDTAFFVFDYAIAAILAIDLGLRAYAFGDVRRWLRRPIVWADFAVLASLIAPVLAANLGFLRVMRLYSLVQGENLWRIAGNGRWDDTNVQDTVRAAANLVIFVFVVNRRPIGTPYRRAKGPPLRLRGSVDAGRRFCAAGGVGRA